MPSRLKWIIGVIIVEIIVQLAFIGSTVVAPRILNVVINVAILKGLFAGSWVAWKFERFFSAMGLVGSCLAFVLLFKSSFGHPGQLSKWVVFLSVIFAVLSSAFVFFSLGMKDVRKFCGVLKKKDVEG